MLTQKKNEKIQYCRYYTNQQVHNICINESRIFPAVRDTQDLQI